MDNFIAPDSTGTQRSRVYQLKAGCSAAVIYHLLSDRPEMGEYSSTRAEM